MRSGFYSVIQFCPDPVRREGVNVGVVVGDGERIHIRFAESTDRVRRMFPGARIDGERFAAAQRALARRLAEIPATEEGLRDFIAKESSSLVLLPPLRSRVEGLQASADRLFEQFVAEPSGPRPHVACPQCGFVFDPQASRVNRHAPRKPASMPLRATLDQPWVLASTSASVVSPVEGAAEPYGFRAIDQILASGSFRPSRLESRPWSRRNLFVPGSTENFDS